MQHQCRDGGYLIGSDDWYPDDPHTFQFFPLGPRIGCTHLTCTVCGGVVHSRAATRIIEDARPSAAPKSTANIAANVLSDAFAAGTPTAGVEADASTRAYACRCSALNVVSPMQAFAPNADPSVRPPTTWRCAGHDALDLATATAVREQLGLAGPIDWGAWLDALPPSRRHPKVDAIAGFEAQRLFHVLRPGDEREQLGDAIVRGLGMTGARLEIALRFFLVVTSSPWDAALLAAAPRAATWAADDQGIRSYRRWLEALGWRLDKDPAAGSVAEAARDLLRAHALTPPGIGANIHTLRINDAAWVAANVR